MQFAAIVDYGTGNVSSIGRALAGAGHAWKHTRDPREILAASHLILPGVGHGGEAMGVLEASGMLDALNEAVHHRKVPVLGICLGMQLMTARTEEGGRDCLGWFPQETIELCPSDSRFKVPNMGWHAISGVRQDDLLAGIALADEPFYFCHRYGVTATIADDASAILDYGDRYVAVLRSGNIVGVQFHPEKSQEPGVALFRNFLAMERAGV